MSWLRLFKGDGYRLDGIFRGKVVDSKDPLKLGRVKVRVYPVMVDVKKEDLPWAEPCFGSFIRIPQVNEWVWVMFQEGDVLRPVWLGWSIPFDESGSGLSYVKESAGNSFDKMNWLSDGLYEENNAEYPEAMVVRHRSGSRLVFHDSGEIVILNKAGAKIVLHSNGNVTVIGKRIDLNP